MAKSDWVDGQTFHATDEDALASELNTVEARREIVSVTSNQTLPTSTLVDVVAIVSDGVTATLPTAVGTTTKYTVKPSALGAVSALLHMDNTNGLTTIVDSSPLAADWTPLNGATLSATQSKFGGAAATFLGSLSFLAASADPSYFTFGTGDFTMEAWIYGTAWASGSFNIIFDFRNSSNTIGPCLTLNNGNLAFWSGASQVITGTAVSLNAWHHVAVSRVSGQTRLFLDGVQVGSTYADSNNYANPGAGLPRIGNAVTSSLPFGSGNYIDEARVTLGYARYTANFTPPTAPFITGATVATTASQTIDGLSTVTVADGNTAVFVPVSGNWSHVLDTPNSPSTVVEYFTTQSSLPVPSGITGVWVEALIGPGAGGGSGRRGASGTVCCGGGAGAGGGAFFNQFVPVARLGTTFTVTLPAGGAGAAAVTVDGTNGNAAANAASASFASGSFFIQTWPAVGGGGGTATAGTAGSAGLGMWNGGAGGAASASGGAGAQGGLTASTAPSGGGAGGGITTAPAASNGGAGGWQLATYTFTVAAGGVVGGASPGTGSSPFAGVGGLGAGGGASSITGAAQTGGTATGYGAGGGGGGASLNGFNSGAGGNGGPSYARLRWEYV